MKRINYYAMMTAALVFAAACNKESGNTPEEPETELALSETELSFDYEGGTKYFTIKANKENPSVSVIEDDKTWISFSVEDKTVSVSVSKNESAKSRNSVVTVKLEDLTKRVRIEQEGAPSPEDMPKVFQVPSLSDFAESKVLKVMNKDIQVGQVCREYLLGEGANNQAIVVYPVNDGVVDITRGFVVTVLEQKYEEGIPTDVFTTSESNIHGGSVAFDASANKISNYLKGKSEASGIKFVKINRNGNVSAAESIEGCVEASLVADTCRDADGNVYGIVKIAGQYWMSSDLKTTTTMDGNKLQSDITDASTWASVPAYRPSCMPDYANLYNATACGYKDGSFTDAISPEGFTIPSNSQFDALTTYLSQDKVTTVGDKLKESGWDFWGIFTGYTTGGTNITGFGARGIGYGNADGTLAPDGDKAHVFYITSTTYDGGLGRYNINQSADSFLLQPEGGCALGYGVRSIRK